jgi:tetratricopeptide (TPR) repeat protein
MKNSWRWLFLVGLGLALYGQTFGFSFVFDDNFFLLDNNYIRSFGNIDQLWTILPKTRLVGIYSFALNYQMNQLHPAGYHIVNFFIHLLAVGLVWALAEALFKQAGYVSRELPFFIAVLFLVHPCQTQAVSYISQRFESIATVFYLGSIYCYIRARRARLKAHSFYLFICSAGCAVLGLFTKEVAATIPLMILAAELILFKRDPLNAKKHPSGGIYLVIFALGLLFLLLFMKMVRTNFINEYLHFSAPSESHEGDIITVGKYILTQMRVFLTFLRLLILPINQNVDYDYPLSTGLFDPPLTFVGLCLIAFITFLVFKLQKQWPLISFGLAWVLITFSINTAPRVNVIFEHKLYLISFGFFLVMVSVLSMLIKDRRYLLGSLMMIAAVLSLITYKRNHVWRNEITLWEDAVQKSPYKSRPRNNLGVFLGMEGNYAGAVSEFDKAIAIKPDFAESYNNRGNTYSKEGNYTQAISDLTKAIALKPDYVAAYCNLGIVYDKQGDINKALLYYDKAIKIDPKYENVYYKRGLIFAKQGHFDQALSDLDRAIVLNPVNVEAYVNRGVIYARESNLALALQDYNRAIDIDPYGKSAFINRGTFYARQGEFVKALMDYNKAIELDPDSKDAFFNRAVDYYQLKEYNKAWGDVAKANELGAFVNPEFISDLKKASGQNRQFK